MYATLDNLICIDVQYKPSSFIKVRVSVSPIATAGATLLHFPIICSTGMRYTAHVCRLAAMETMGRGHKRLRLRNVGKLDQVI